MPSDLPLEELNGLFFGAWTLLGLLVGSFLNVAIHRLPREGESVQRPRRSYCPGCRATLRWSENVPLLSWIVQRGRCRHCSWRIPWRYPLVEALCAAAFALVAWRTGFGAPGLLAVRTLVLCGLIVATFVDFEHYEIPDEISLGGMALAPLAALAVPSLHEHSAAALWLTPAGESVGHLGALLACGLGMAAGGGVLLAIGWLGKLLYGRDAMGLGDVKLLCAAGGFIGPGGALAALMIASVCASLVGVLGMLRWAALSLARARRRGRPLQLARALRIARICGRYVPFGPHLALGIGIALLAWNDMRAWID
jgi:leader peptidase (prepilin peptidase)/N-methyltransferase